MSIDMNISDRYKEISRLSGASEEIVRAVLRACQQTAAKSLQGGNEVTIPGLVTFIPTVKSNIDIQKQDVTKYVGIRAKASQSLTALMNDPNRNKYVSEGKSIVEDLEDNLNYMSESDIQAKNAGIRLRQIGSLT
jgi:hypothetical protein